MCGMNIARAGYRNGMKTVEKWHWRIRWAGKQTTTRIHYTEDEIRREHPEAVRIDASRITMEVPETLAELDAAMRQRDGR
jgi:hypothetical protein